MTYFLWGLLIFALFMWHYEAKSRSAKKRILHLLMFANRELRLRDFVHLMDESYGMVTWSLEALEKKGFISSRKEKEGEKEYHLWSVTKAGRDKILW